MAQVILEPQRVSRTRSSLRQALSPVVANALVSLGERPRMLTPYPPSERHGGGHLFFLQEVEI